LWDDPSGYASKSVHYIFEQPYKILKITVMFWDLFQQRLYNIDCTQRMKPI